MEHDPNINHSNKDINQSLTKYNVHGVIAHRDKILKQHYGRLLLNITPNKNVLIVNMAVSRLILTSNMDSQI